MDRDELSRRLLLQAIAATIGAAAIPAGWMDLAHAAARDAQDAKHRHDAQASGNAKLTFFSASDAADVEAVAAQIIPTDDTPGAREAGVIQFIDGALAIHLTQLATDYRAQLADFQAAFRAHHPGAASFSSIAADQQIAYLKTVDRTPFFETTRLLTLLGMFTMPRYGGNRDGIGWKLIGFESQHSFAPPFGFYDRDYPGFAAAVQPERTK
jgi:gluconate 2-dehydrogenase gamma chain